MSTPAISFRAIAHDFRSTDGSVVRALHHIDMEIRHGEFAVVVGPSGCGKSTLLRLIAGLIAPTAGSVRVFDHPVTGPRDDIGIVFQKPTLLPWLDVLSNITFPIRHRGQLVTAADTERALDLLDLVGLADFRKKFPDELSGGMQQRVGIARALLSEPDILLMDEPFSALDALTRDEMSFELLRLWSARRGTALFITHSITEAVLLADRIFVMSPRPGRIRETLAVDLPRPRTPETLRAPRFQELAAHIRNQLLGTHELH
ncbi:ABC transporter ATP-binding protein [Microvirga lotononidis]|uniref:ABC-type nitrate/sulfonate/bicarbonate transport system, ATPase component n=1 Tax=Microvirga lotononidis TaxID=864069 RepID=I4YSQ5_9HYPH|nr:ABC transporter ATP-binding protein [Microvirga lotononidis]EIM26997.1 ABC-type nitrate/sulfonate/bicarbonate transport system, ATPase component [Microvirga lotononidis]WQO28810.1 ABC transporter ATP-binding protein [Microvirga lotononidis]